MEGSGQLEGQLAYKSAIIWLLYGLPHTRNFPSSIFENWLKCPGKPRHMAAHIGLSPKVANDFIYLEFLSKSSTTLAYMVRHLFGVGSYGC